VPEPHAPSRSPESPVQERERLRALVVEQAAPIEQLRERIQELEARLAQDSHNSGKPPSSTHRSGNHRRARSANRAGASREAKRVLPTAWSRTLTNVSSSR